MHTATRGLRWVRRAQDTARSLRTVAASRVGPQYAVTSTSLSLQAAVHADVAQFSRMIRT